MYKIIKNGVLVGITGAPTYIKMMDNGCYGLCSKEEAQGVAFDGVPYHMDGRAKMDGADTTSVVEDSDATVSRDHTAAAQVFVEQCEMGNISEEDAKAHKGLFPLWSGDSVKVYDGTDGEHPQTWMRGRTSGLLYKCNIGHTTQDGWPPETTPNLWTEVAEIGEYREIKDGMLSTEAFALGEIGWYKAKDNLYKSLIAANVYTPDTYPSGWEKVTC